MDFCHTLTWISHGFTGVPHPDSPFRLPPIPSINKNSFESVLMRWMKLEPIIRSEVSQKDKDQYSILMIMGYCFSSILQSYRMRIGQIKMPQNSLYLLRFGHLFWTNAPWIATSLLFISRFLKKLILADFTSVLIAFMQKRLFRCPYSSIFTDVTPALLFLYYIITTFWSLSHIYCFTESVPLTPFGDRNLCPP